MLQIDYPGRHKNGLLRGGYKNHPYAIELFEQANVKVEKVELTEPVIDFRKINQ